MVNHYQRVARECGVRLTVADCRDFNMTGMTMLFQLEGKRQSMQRAVTELRKLKGVRSLLDTGLSGTRTLCLTALDRPNLCAASMGTGILCLQCPYNDAEENPTWQVLVDRQDNLMELISRLDRRGVRAKIASISQVNQEALLTGRQKEVLAMAISLGYFDFPRKISLTELSKKVSIKPSTLSEVLRNAERKIMRNTAKSIHLPLNAAIQEKEPFVLTK